MKSLNMTQGMRFFIVFMVIFFAASCNSKAPDKNNLAIQLTSEPVSLDFSTAEDGISMRIFGFLMSGMMRVNGKGVLVNEIAEKIETLNSGSRYIIYLKKWKWSDGVDLKASDFVYGVKRTLDPKIISKLTDLLFFIKNAVLYKQSKITDFSKVGIKALDDSRIQIELESNFTFFPQLLSLSIFFPQRQDLIEKEGPKWTEKMVTTGPYTIEKWQHQRELVLIKNQYYPENISHLPNRITLPIITDEMTPLNLFDSDKLDLVSRIPTLEMERFKKTNQVLDFPFFATYYIGFNQKAYPWNQKKARIALAQSIDRVGILKSLNSGEYEATSWIPKGVPGSNETIGIKYDPQKAKDNFKSVSKNKTDSFVLGFDSGSRNQMIVEKIKQDIKNNLNLNLELKARDWKTYVRELTSNTPALFRFGFLSLFSDPYAHLFLFQSDNPNNYTGWKSAKYDELLAKIAKLDPVKESAKRQKLVNEAQKIICEEEVVVVPIYHYIQRVLVSKKIQNIEINGLGLIDLKTLKVAL